MDISEFFMVKKLVEKEKNIKYKDKYLDYILYFLLALFVYVFIVNAWVGDDAYITFRTVDNFVNGYGLTWNTGERVQAYTHPLWMFIHSIVYSITGNIYYATMLLSFAFSFAAVWLLVYKFAANKLFAISGLIVLLISKIFIDYTSSGLENPLTYFLIMLFLIYYFNNDETPKKLFKLSLVTALIMLNRMDLMLLFFPALLYIIITNWKLKHLLYVFYGFIPFILWELFSIIYYGFPFPNTYYAKLNTGIPIGEYISQGLSYYANLFNNDPMSGIVIFSGIIGIIVYSIKTKNVNIYLPLVTGIVLYLLYILRIGGDFMSGRFFTGPFLMVVALLTIMSNNLPKLKNIYIVSFILLSLSIIRFATFNNDYKSYNEIRQIKNFDLTEYNDDLDRNKHGIEDERKYYFKDTGLLKRIIDGSSEPTFPEVRQGKMTRANAPFVCVRVMIGAFGYFAGPNIKIIDRVALSDAFLSRLKFSYDTAFSKGWRIGHFFRKIPLGYTKTVEKNNNHLEDKKLKIYFEKLKFVTQSSIFNLNRFKEIWKMNTGYYDYLLHANYEYNDLPQLFSADENAVMTHYLRTGNYYYLKYHDRVALNFYLKLLYNEKWIRYHNVRGELYKKATIMYMKFGKPDSAIYFAEKGFITAQNNDFAKYFTNFIYKFYKARKQPDKALNILDYYLRFFPNEIPILKNKADFFVSFGQHEKAVDIWKRIIEIDPSIGNSYYNLFAYYYNKKQMDSAAYYAFKSVERGEKIEPYFLELLKKYKH